MSFPNIPDINPCINITIEEAVNLLLTSIALEEVSISKLMDAETCKILYVLDDCIHKDCDSCGCKHKDRCCHECKHDNCVLHDALQINKSVDETIQNLIKMQMLLQFKLEKVKEIIPSTSTCSTTSTSTTTTTTCTRTTTCSTSTCSTTTKRPCECLLNGKGKGRVENLFDEFNGQTAFLKSVASCSDTKNRSIYYIVEKNDVCFYFYASNFNIKIECPCQNPDKIILYGKGQIEMNTNCDEVIKDYAEFKLEVSNVERGHTQFLMEIKSGTNLKFYHNSGIVQVDDYDSTLKLEVHC